VQGEGWIATARKVRDRLSKSRRADAFDEQYRVETAREVSLFRLDIASRHESVGTRYQPSPREVCDQLLASLPIRYEDFTFVDLGAGKGRVLLVGSRFPFRRLIGVEFAMELVETARENIERFHSRAEMVHADAADYRFPSDNLVVYLYNPFGPEVLRPVLRSLREISRRHEVYVLYLNPKNASYVEEFANQIYELPDAKVYRFRAALPET
jgi:predicted RNA methylase